MKKICDFLIELLIIILLVSCLIFGVGLFAWGIIEHPIITVLFLILLIIYIVLEDKYTRHKYQNPNQYDLQK